MSSVRIFFLNFFVFHLIAFPSLYAISNKPEAPKAILFNDTSAWYHWGCTGKSTALKEHIQKLGFQLEAIPITVTYSLLEVPPFEEFDSLEKFYHFQKVNEDVVQKIHKTDVVIIAGEGTIHDLRSGPKALLYLAYISKKFFNKHVEIVHQSVYPKDDVFLSRDFLDNFQVEKEKSEKNLFKAQIIYSTIFNLMDFVAIREPFSQETMSRIGVSSTLTFDCLPLYIRDHYFTKKDVQDKTVVISGSVAFTKSGVEHLCRYIEYLDQQGYNVKVLIGAAAFPSNDDAIFVQCLQTHLKVPVNFIFASSMEEWLDTINHAVFIVSGRFSNTIAAFCLNTPFIALNSNTHKVHSVCYFLNRQSPLLYFDPFLLQNLIARTEDLLMTNPEDNQEKMKEIYYLAEKNFDGLKEYLKTYQNNLLKNKLNS